MSAVGRRGSAGTRLARRLLQLFILMGEGGLER
jgi:hypothetical protein